jgi:hypothetical protein
MKTTFNRRIAELPPDHFCHESCAAKIYTAGRQKNGQSQEHTLAYSEGGKRVRRVFGAAEKEAKLALKRIASGPIKALTLTNADAEAARAV